MPAPTIKDVATAAGVSTATVSHVLNDNGRAGAKSRARVIAAIEALNFRRNHVAASLRSRRSKLVGLVVPSLTNAYFARMSSEFEKLAFASGYEIAVITSDADPVRERHRIQTLMSRQLDGLIVYPASDQSIGNGLDPHLLPPALVMDRGLSLEGFDSVGLNNTHCARQVARELIAWGHAEIAILLPDLELAASRDRAQGIAAELNEAGLPRPRIILAGETIDGARTVLEQELHRQDRVTAVVATTNVATLGAIKALQGLGLSMPGDVSLIGFDDFEWMTALRPYVSAVGQPFEALAARGWDLLLARMSGQAGQSQFAHHLVEGELRIRESCGKRRDTGHLPAHST